MLLNHHSFRLAASVLLIAGVNHFAIAADAPAEPPRDTSRDVAVIVNGEPVTQATVDLLMNAKRQRGAQGDDEELLNQTRSELITRSVLSQQARSLGLDKQPDVQTQNLMNEQAVLAQAYLRDYSTKVEVKEAELKKKYKEYLERSDFKEYRVRQILVRDEALAKKMVAELEQGADFAELARKNSVDPGADQTGGDIGWFRPEIFIDKRFSAAVTKLAKGEYTKQPVFTRFGWHVIKLDDGPRKVKMPEFAELDAKFKDKLRSEVVMARVDDHVKVLTDKAKVVEPDGKAAPAQVSAAN